MTIGTLFTLFVVPSVYVLIAKDHRNERRRVVRVPEPDIEGPTLVPARASSATVPSTL